jgi:hypothetical protein
MRHATLLTTIAAVLVLFAAPAARSYPPRNCGRETVKGITVIVTTHGPTCGFAKSGVKAWMSSHRAPSGFGCKSYAGDEPAYCKHRSKKNYYFQGIKA